LSAKFILTPHLISPLTTTLFPRWRVETNSESDLPRVTRIPSFYATGSSSVDVDNVVLKLPRKGQTWFKMSCFRRSITVTVIRWCEGLQGTRGVNVQGAP
jgi:hypothetical protein